MPQLRNKLGARFVSRLYYQPMITPLSFNFFIYEVLVRIPK